MKTAVRYISRTGNTRKVAEAIASALGVTAQTADTSLDASVDLLFVGGGLYASREDDRLTEFLAALSPEQVKSVAVFSTAFGQQTLVPRVKKLLSPQGIPVHETSFHCRGKFLFFSRNSPTQEDLQNAASFARRLASPEM